MSYQPDFPPEPPPEWDEYEIPADFEPEPVMIAPGQAALPGFEPSPVPRDHWFWLDSRFVGLATYDDGGEIAGYEVGCADLYADPVTGDLGGSFLPVQQFGPDQVDSANDLLNRLEGYAFEQGMAAHDLPDLAERAAAKIAGREGLPPPEWRGLTDDEYRMFAQELGMNQQPEPDFPPEVLDDDLLRLAYELGGVEVDVSAPHPAAQALGEIGLAAADFDPDADPPPFYDQATNTAYWIGVYQPDANDQEVCVASILSLTRDPQNGAYEALLAPCVAGDWDTAYQASEHLIRIAERSDDIERVFEAAEGMAIAAGQRESWENERGVWLDPDSANDIGSLAEQTWEVDL